MEHTPLPTHATSTYPYPTLSIRLYISTPTYHKCKGLYLYVTITCRVPTKVACLPILAPMCTPFAGDTLYA